MQFLATILHDPTILVMDEPFSGLDPVNANVLKEAFLEMHSRGKTIIFSTHQLEQVEELCQDIVIINKGQSIVQGSVQEVKRQQGRNVARLKLDNDPEARWLDTLEGVQVTKRRQDYIEMHIQANLNPNLIVEAVLLYGMGVALGVAEEKGSRIMEILVSAATPFQLMAGKIIGIGAAGLTQMACVVAVGIGALLLQSPLQAALFGANSGGLTLNITSVSITLLLLLLVYFILGFLLYATLFAAMGALVKRQDEVQNAVAPLTFLLVIGYIVSYFGVYSPDATWMKVISYIPFWTPTTMLVRIGASGVAWWEIPFTIALMIVAIFVCAVISARIYRFGVLMYGQRPGLGQLAKLVRMK